MAEVETIAPSNLLIDAANPRLKEPNQGQNAALRAIATDQKKKLVVLARDIVEHGLNQADLPIVTPHKTDKSRFTVLEGNRRIAALKALESPDTLVGAIDSSLIGQLRAISKQYLQNPVYEITCWVVKDAEEAHHWIKLRHTGENQGAGIVPWGSEEASRFNARTVGLPLETQVLNFLEKGKYITSQQRNDVPPTSLRRLIATPQFRETVGITIEKGEVKLLGPKDKVGKALAHVVKDLAYGQTTTKDIYHAKQRIEYAKKIPKKLIVKPTNKPAANLPTDAQADQKKPIVKKVRRPNPRDRLIANDCVLQVTAKRVQAIEDELRRLKIADYPNAIGVLFRVFFELSVDAYIDTHTLKPPNEKLSVKALAVVEDLVKHKKLTPAQAKPVRKACAKNSYLAPSIAVMNEYVHNQWAFPLPSDLRAYWDNLQPFFVAIWTP